MVRLFNRIGEYGCLVYDKSDMTKQGQTAAGLKDKHECRRQES